MIRFISAVLAAFAALHVLLAGGAMAQHSDGRAGVFPDTVADEFLSVVPVQLSDHLHSRSPVFWGDLGIVVEVRNGEYTMAGYAVDSADPIWELPVVPKNGGVGEYLSLAENGRLYLIGQGTVRAFQFDKAIPIAAPEPLSLPFDLTDILQMGCGVTIDKQANTDPDGFLVLAARTTAPCETVSNLLIVLTPKLVLEWVHALEDVQISAPVFGPDGAYVYIQGDRSGLMAFHRKNPELRDVSALPNQAQLRSDGTWTFQKPVIQSSDRRVHTIVAAANTHNGGGLAIKRNSALLDSPSIVEPAAPVLSDVWEANAVSWCGQWGPLLLTESGSAPAPGQANKGSIVAAYIPSTGSASCAGAEMGAAGIVGIEAGFRKTSDAPEPRLTGIDFALLPQSSVFHPQGFVFGLAADGVSVIAADISGRTEQVFRFPVPYEQKVQLALSPANAVYLTDGAGTNRGISVLATGVSGVTLADVAVESSNSLVLTDVATTGAVNIRAATAMRLRSGVLRKGVALSVTLPLR